MTKKKSDRRFVVRHAFAVRTEDGSKIFITRGNQHRIGELLTTKQIDTHKEAGNIIERDSDTSVDSTTAVYASPTTSEEEDSK